MAIEFNPDSGKQVPKRKTLKQQSVVLNKTKLADSISGKNKPKFEDASDAIDKLLKGEVDMKAALGFIKSIPDPQPEEVDASELVQQLIDGEIDRETFKAAMHELGQNDLANE